MVSYKVQNKYSLQHFYSAKYFAIRALEFEKEFTIETIGEIEKSNYKSYITGSIISVVAGLEASINELYLEACDNNPHTLNGLSNNVFIKLCASWKDIESWEILDKYDNALHLASNKRFDRGASPFQEIDDLVKLRNALVHYKPEWHTEMFVHKKIYKRLKNRFPHSPFYIDTLLWFPHKCLGGGCANWAVEASRKFIESFCIQMGIPNRFSLKTL